jgi:Tat protein secretion system quality control protein TatD with DNase activity
VRHVAEHVAELREIPFEALTAATTANFTRLFKVAL